MSACRSLTSGRAHRCSADFVTAHGKQTPGQIQHVRYFDVAAEAGRLRHAAEIGFYRATAKHTHGTAVEILSVRLSSGLMKYAENKCKFYTHAFCY